MIDLVADLLNVLLEVVAEFWKILCLRSIFIH
jgi:hypothetical protein